MTIIRKHLYLYLTLLCFLGIVLIFVFDGYLGVYDSLSMDNGQYVQTVEADQWTDEKYRYVTSMSVERDSRVEFIYKIENNRFSEYTSDIEVTLLRNQEIIAELISTKISADSFDSGEITWTFDTTELIPADFPLEQSFNANLIIETGDIERNVLINVYPSPYAPKPVRG